MLRPAGFIALGVLLFLGQGCLSDPPRENRPILYIQDEEDPADVALDPVVSATSGWAVPPPLKPGETGSAGGNVVISSVVANQTLPNPFIVLGRARSFENAVAWRVRDSRGQVLAEGNVATDAGDARTFGSYRVRAFYDRMPDTAEGRVEVFVRSPRDGAEQDLVTVPVRLERAITSVKVFFVDQTRDPALLHCDKVYPVTRRIPKTENVAEAALRELLRGPSASEQSSGFRTSVMPGTELRTVSIDGNTATVDFSRSFALGIAGACRVTALRAQVEQTLKQFPNVTAVKILVEGADAEPYLQP